MKLHSKEIAILFASLSILLVASASNATEMSKGPYLIYPNNNTQMTVLWQMSDSEVGDCLLEWGTTEACEDDSEFVSVNSVTYQYEHTIGTGDDEPLNPGTKYFYQVREGVESGDYHTGSFRTAPAPNATDVKFLAYGDTRANAGEIPYEHNNVCSAMIDTYTAVPDYQTFTLHSGDWINQDTENDWSTMFFNRSLSNAMEMQANLPIQGCMGNHEGRGTFCESVYAKYWPYIPDANPDNDDWYSFDYGPVHVVVINEYRHENWNEQRLNNTQLGLVEDDLEESNKQWKFIVLHAPGWSAGPYPSAPGGHLNHPYVQDDIQPICVRQGVDMVFAGHNHYYCRCYVNGVRHITTGGGGAPLKTPIEPPGDDDHPNIVEVDESYHFCEIDIHDDILYFIARDKDGNIIDAFVLTKADIPETWEFYVKDSSDKVVAWFDNLGNLGLKGSLYEYSNFPETGNSEFVVKNSSGEKLAVIDTVEGDMYIKGEAHPNQPLSYPYVFMVISQSFNDYAYIDVTGNLWMTGEIYQGESQ